MHSFNITRVANEQHDDIIDTSEITYGGSVNYIIITMFFVCSPVHFSSLYFYGNRRELWESSFFCAVKFSAGAR